MFGRTEGRQKTNYFQVRYESDKIRASLFRALSDDASAF